MAGQQSVELHANLGIDLFHLATPLPKIGTRPTGTNPVMPG
jgi:hypothetical protein